MVVLNVPPHRRTTMRFLALFAAVAIAAGSDSIQAQTVCRPADAQTANMISYMKVLVAATVPADSESVGIRTAYKIPAANPTQVTLVTKEQTCKSALAAFNSKVPGQSPVATRIYVVAVGSVYVVWNPRQGVGAEWAPNLILNSKFQFLEGFGG